MVQIWRRGNFEPPTIWHGRLIPVNYLATLPIHQIAPTVSVWVPCPNQNAQATQMAHKGLGLH